MSQESIKNGQKLFEVYPDKQYFNNVFMKNIYYFIMFYIILIFLTIIPVTGFILQNKGSFAAKLPLFAFIVIILIGILLSHKIAKVIYLNSKYIFTTTEIILDIKYFVKKVLYSEVVDFDIENVKDDIYNIIILKKDYKNNYNLRKNTIKLKYIKNGNIVYDKVLPNIKFED